MTRRKLIEAMIAAPDRAAARRLARQWRQLADDRAATLLLDRFTPLPVGDRPRAEATARTAAVIAECDRGATSRAIAARLRGVLDHLAGRSVRARAALEKAAKIYGDAGLWIDAGDVRRILVDVLMRVEDYPGAAEMARLARKSYARGGGADAQRIGSLELNLANVHHRRDEHRRALDAYARARREFQRADDPLRVAIVDYNRANVLATLDRTAEARRLYEAAGVVFRQRRVEALVIQADFSLAALDLAAGRLDACLARLQESRRKLESLDDTLRIAHVDLDAAEALLRLNRPSEADRCARRAGAFFRRAGQRAESAMCAAALGAAALQRGDTGQARQHFGRSRALHERLENPTAAALAQIGEAQSELQAGRAVRAMELAQSAASVLEKRQMDSRQARALAVGARAALEAGNLRRSGNWAHKARLLARRRGDLRVELASELVLGNLEQRQGRSAQAYSRFRAAERCVEKLRRGVSTDESQLAFSLDKSEVYEALVLNRLRRGDKRSVRQALTFAERGKSRALAERLAVGRTSPWGGTAAARKLLDRLAALEEQLSVAENRLQDSQSTPGLRSKRTRRVAELTRERMQTLDRLSSQDPDRASLAGATPPEPLEFARTLRQDEIVLEYTAAGGAFHLFAIERDRVEAFPDLARVEQVGEIAELLRFQLSKGVLGCEHAVAFGDVIERTIRTHLARLHELLLRPVADRIGGRSVRIIPHGALHGMPFHAMEHDGVALIEHCLVSYAPSLVTLRLLARERGACGSPPLVLGVPDQTAPLITDEVAAVRRHVRHARVFQGDRATRRALRLSEQRPPLLHVACHGFYGEGQPWSSALRLGDAWLSLPDLYSMRGTARLVVLSGCETGRGTVYSGDEWVGLVRGFLQVGARTVVASLWEVHDDSTVDLMNNFYAGLARGLGVAAALGAAQREARKRDPLPLRWAPFAVVGDPDLRIPVREVA